MQSHFKSASKSLPEAASMGFAETDFKGFVYFIRVVPVKLTPAPNPPETSHE